MCRLGKNDRFRRSRGRCPAPTMRGMMESLKSALWAAACLFAVVGRVAAQEVKTLADLPANRAAVLSVQYGAGSAGAREDQPTPDQPDSAPIFSAGGGSRAGGGDPTTPGRAQEVGNRHL